MIPGAMKRSSSLRVTAGNSAPTMTTGIIGLSVEKSLNRSQLGDRGGERIRQRLPLRPCRNPRRASVLGPYRRMGISRIFNGVSNWPSRDPIGEFGGLNLFQMVGNNTIGRWDFLGLHVYPPYYSFSPAEYEQAPGQAEYSNGHTNFGGGKKCGCFDFYPSSLGYRKYNIKRHDGNKVAGVGVYLGLHAIKNDSNGPDCPKCYCNRVKVVQIVKTVGKTLSPYKEDRTSPGDLENEFNGWRMDTPKSGDGFVPGEEHHSKLLQGVIDIPGFDKINSSNRTATFEAYTCLICADENNTKMGGKVIGCINWGFTVTGLGGENKSVTKINTQSVVCGDNAKFKAKFQGARIAWDAAPKPVAGDVGDFFDNLTQ